MASRKKNGRPVRQKYKKRDLKDYAVCEPGGFMCKFPIKTKKDLNKAKNFAIDHETDLWKVTYKRSNKDAKKFNWYKSKKIYDPYNF